MKIGILTLPLHFNYGGALQNWALQQVLIHMGHNPEMICRRNHVDDNGPSQKALYCMLLIKNILLGLLGKRKYFRLSNPFSREFSTNPLYMDYGFVNRIIKSRKCFDNEGLLNVVKNGGYEAFIVGSDQVWRQKYSPRIETYFLDFLTDGDSRKRIAYAASFGKTKDYIDKNKMPECRRLLQKFDAISVREDEGIDIVNNDFGVAYVRKVLDPTLLLTPDMYDLLIKKEDIIAISGITAYILDNSDEKAQVLEDIASTIKYDIRRFSGEFNNSRPNSVSEWLAAIRYAKFVVTDSYHGCIFSILFNRPFVAIANKYRGLGRFTSLLNELNLMDRLILCKNDYMVRKATLLNKPIDWQKVNDRLAELRISSLNWLKNALKE